MHRGYVKLWRKIRDNPVVWKDPEHLAVWAYLMLEAAYSQKQSLFNGKSIILNPGQLTTGRRQISLYTGVSESKIQRVLKFFQSEQLIEQQTCRVNRLITVLSWNKHQSSEQQSEQQVNNDRTTSEQQVNTLKEGKKVKKVKKVKKETSPKNADGFSDEFLEWYGSYPRKVGRIAAWKKYKARKRAGATAEELIKARDNYADAVKHKAKEFIRHPSTFLDDDWREWLENDQSEKEKPVTKKDNLHLLAI